MPLTKPKIKDFINIKDVPADDLRRIIDMAALFKSHPRTHYNTLLNGQTLAMIFEKPSTRTRVSFEVAIKQLGGHSVVLQSSDMQLGRGETVSDTAKVLSRYVDIVMLRALSHHTMEELVNDADIPVINGLTDLSHPCQIMADILTIEEYLGRLPGKTVAWVGDCNNVCRSWAEATKAFNFNFHLACPDEFITDDVRPYIKSFTDPKEAVKDAHVVIADTFISMGVENPEERRARLTSYQVNKELMQLADEDAIFLHCLPATRGEEVTAEIIDGTQSAVWDEAENRLHVQKAILCWCLGTTL